MTDALNGIDLVLVEVHPLQAKILHPFGLLRERALHSPLRRQRKVLDFRIFLCYSFIKRNRFCG